MGCPCRDYLRGVYDLGQNGIELTLPTDVLPSWFEVEEEVQLNYLARCWVDISIDQKSTSDLRATAHGLGFTQVPTHISL